MANGESHELKTTAYRLRSDGLHDDVFLSSLGHLTQIQSNKQYENAGCMNNFWSHCIFQHKKTIYSK